MKAIDIAITEDSTPATILAQYIRGKDFTDEQMSEIYDLCKQFVCQYRITHYVSSISLGASMYQVLSEEEYVKRIGSSGSVGFEAVAKSAVKTTITNRFFKRTSMKYEIGK